MDAELEPLRPDAGVTLIELLVVVAVLAVLAVGVSVTAIRAGPGSATADMHRFHDTYGQMRGQAIAGHRRLGLFIRPQDMARAYIDADGWTPLGARPVPWRGRVTFAPQGAFQTGLDAPQIIFLPTGQSTAFEITFTAQGQSPKRCISDGWSGLTC